MIRSFAVLVALGAMSTIGIGSKLYAAQDARAPNQPSASMTRSAWLTQPASGRRPNRKECLEDQSARSSIMPIHRLTVNGPVREGGQPDGTQDGTSWSIGDGLILTAGHVVLEGIA